MEASAQEGARLPSPRRSSSPPRMLSPTAEIERYFTARSSARSTALRESTSARRSRRWPAGRRGGGSSFARHGAAPPRSSAAQGRRSRRPHSDCYRRTRQFVPGSLPWRRVDAGEPATRLRCGRPAPVGPRSSSPSPHQPYLASRLSLFAGPGMLPRSEPDIDAPRHPVTSAVAHGVDLVPFLTSTWAATTTCSRPCAGGRDWCRRSRHRACSGRARSAERLLLIATEDAACASARTKPRVAYAGSSSTRGCTRVLPGAAEPSRSRDRAQADAGLRRGELPVRATRATSRVIDACRLAPSRRRWGDRDPDRATAYMSYFELTTRSGRR